MNKKKSNLILILAFIVLLSGAYVLYQKLSKNMRLDQLSVTNQESTTESNDNTEEPVKVPDFTVVDQSGNEVNLSDYFGKPIILNFWASWCGPCKMEMPDFNKAYENLGEEVNFFMVNMTDGSRETKEIAQKYIEDQGFSFPVFFDIKSDAAITYNVFSLPTTYFIDAEGYPIAKASGAIDQETLQKGIDMIYSKE